MESPLRRARSGDLTLIETFRWEPEAGFLRLPAHLARLARGAEALGVAVDGAAVERALAVVGGAAPQRVRLTVTLAGAVAVSASPLVPGPAVWTVRLARERLDSRDPWLALKTSRRPEHDAARAALPAGTDEALLLNERGELCEGTVTNVFADAGDGLVTPPLSSGLLPGVLRAELIERGACHEAVVRAVDLGRARLFVGNSLRGLMPARLVAAP